MPPPLRPRPSWVLLLILAIALVWAVRDLLRPVAPEVDVQAYVAAYGSLTDRLPVDAKVGYLQLTESVDASAVRFAAQFALAPRLLDTAWGDVSFVVTPPFVGAAVDRDPRLEGFEFAFAGDGGVRVYRRASR